MSFVNKVQRKLGKVATLAKAKVQNNGIHAFWWSGKKNFGDLLTPELFARYGYTAIETPTERADVIGVGSLMHMVPKDYSGVLLGTGIIDDSKFAFEHATFASVRGELSKANVGLPADTPTGDLGLLARQLLRDKLPPKRFKLGLIPHFVDKHHPWVKQTAAALGTDGTVIEVQDSAENVIRQVAECDAVISSSLHGIIVSDALGIPNVWMELSDKVIGAGFKFWDYNSSVDYEQAPLKIAADTTLADVESAMSSKNHDLISGKSQQLEGILLSTLQTLSGQS